MKTIAQVLASIYFRAPQGIRLGLERIAHACERAGSPHRAFPVVHIAGTNGKGSVSAMTASVLQHAGYRVGLFTSPHLCRFAERIQVNGAPIDDARLVQVIDQAVSTDPSLSFFETAFLAALLAFRQENVDVAVLEVGLGGRLDATNVVPDPLVTAVTNIAFDHTDRLGNTLEAIAVEKASIAKPSAPMVLGPMPPSASEAARQCARAAGTPEIYCLGQDIRIVSPHPGAVDVWLPEAKHPLRVHPSLRGRHQLDNAAVATLVSTLAGRSLSKVTFPAICRGIAEAKWPGRLESLSDGDGEVLIDAAHNPNGVRSLIDYLQDRSAPQPHDPHQTALVFGAMADKHWDAMLQSLTPLAQHRFFVAPPTSAARQAAPTEQMSERFGGQALGDISQALRQARQAVGAQGLVVVAGSIFLSAEVRATLLGLPRDPPVAL